MGAASVHTLPRRQAGIDADGQVEDGMPHTLQEAYDVIQTLSRKFTAACGQITRLTNELEGKRLAEIEASQIMDILVNWRDTLGKDPAKVQLVAGGKRWERIRARLHDKIEGRGPWTADELKLVPVGALESEWHNGSNPKTQGKRYLEVETIYRDAEQVEKFVRLARMAEDAAFEERLRAFHEQHPCPVFEAIEQERQLEKLRVVAPEVFQPRPSDVRAAEAAEAAWPETLKGLQEARRAEVVRYEGRTG